MKSTYRDRDGREWHCECADYFENFEDGHSKYYRAMRLIGPLGNWDVFQWGRIGTSPKFNQSQAIPRGDQYSKKLKEKARKGYTEPAVDPENDSNIWKSAIENVAASHAAMNGRDSGPLWLNEHIPSVRL